MKIVFAREEEQNCTWTQNTCGSGYENSILPFGGTWYALKNIWDQEFDFVIVPGTNHQFLIKRGKSPKWRKVLMQQEDGFPTINTYWYLQQIQQANYDGFLAYGLFPLWETFGKPVIKWHPAYQFNRLHNIRHSKKNNRKICLYISRYRDSCANLLGTLAVFNRLNNVQGIAYADTTDELRTIVKNFKLKNPLDVRPPVDWFSYLEATKDVKVFMSMDARQTWGRFDLDAAMVGSRSIGAYTPVREMLWPELIVDYMNADGCVNLINKEMENNNNYIISQENTNSFDPDYMKNKLINSLSKL